MSSKTEDLVKSLSELTVLEMSELKTALEEKWGVKAAAAAVAIAAPAAGEAGGEAAAAEESTDFQVTLQESPADKKISVIKVVRQLIGLGLKEAKELVESAPGVLKESAPKAEANEMKEQLEAVGAKVILKGL